MSQSTSSEKVAIGKPEVLTVADIAVKENGNPRSSFDNDELKALTESIKRQGVLQPILVSPAKDGKGYVLVAGERRLKAVKKAGIKEIPALVREADGRGFEFALVENLQRNDLNPIDQARGFKQLMKSAGLNQKEVATQLGVSSKLISERLVLLCLPERVQELMAEDSIPASLGKTFKQVAKASSELAVVLAESIDVGHIEASSVASDLTSAMYELVSRLAKDGSPIAVSSNGYGFKSIDDVPLPEDKASELIERYRDLEKKAEYPIPFFFDKEDEDAARAYGCLLEIKTPYGSESYICDAGFLADRTSRLLDKREKQIAEKERRASKTGGKDSVAAGDDADVKTERKREYQERQQAKREAHAANLDFGVKLVKCYHDVPLTKDLARLLALLVLEGDAGAIAGSGLRFVKDDWQKIDRKVTKAGKVKEKVVYLDDREELRDKLLDWLAGAKTAEQILGRLVQALVASNFVDTRAVAQSNRIWWDTPSRRHEDVDRILKKLAKPVLPAHLKDVLKDV